MPRSSILSMAPDSKITSRRIFPWLLAGFFLICSVGLFYPSIFTLQGCLLTGDHHEQHYPWARFLDSCLPGSLPWWTWEIHCGFPLLAEGQVAAFYPPNVLLPVFFGADTAYSLNFVLHVFISGFFFALYCRQIGLGWFATALAGMAYLYGDAFGGAYYNFTSLKTLCWFPLALYAVEKIWQTGQRRWGLLLGFAFGMQLLAGYLQIAAYAIAMAFLYFTLRGICRVSTWERRFSDWPHDCLALALACIVGGLLFLPQFLATYPLSQMSARVGLKESFAYIGSFPPWGIATLFYPKMEGSLRTLGLYVGVLPLCMVFASLGQWSKTHVRCWGLMSLFTLLLAMGGYSPLYVALVKLSGFYGFRVPSKLLFFTNTSLAILAGLGLDALCKGETREKGWKWAKGSFLAAVFLAVAGLLVGGYLLSHYRETMIAWGNRLVEKYIYGRPYHVYGLDHYHEKVRAYYDATRELFRISNPYTTLALTVIVVVAVAVCWMRLGWNRKGLGMLCLGLAFGDLFSYHYVNKLVGDISTYQKESAFPATAKFLLQDNAHFRIYGYCGRFEGLSLKPSCNMLFGIEDIGAYSPFVAKRYRELLEGLGAVDDSTGRRVDGPEVVFRKLPLLSMMNVKYILTPVHYAMKDMPEVFRSGQEHIYQNPHAMDRFFLTRDVVFTEDKDMILEKVRNRTWADGRRIWIEGKRTVNLFLEREKDFAEKDYAGSVKITGYSDRAIQIEVSTPEDQWLFGSLFRYPGWDATLDGKPVEMATANYCFCAIPVPKGMHHIAFTFDWKNSLSWPFQNRAAK